MANGEISVDVNVEKTLHETLLGLAKYYRKKHGICIKSVDFNWLGERFGEAIPLHLMSVEVKTQAGQA